MSEIANLNLNQIWKGLSTFSHFNGVGLKRHYGNHQPTTLPGEHGVDPDGEFANSAQKAFLNDLLLKAAHSVVDMVKKDPDSVNKPKNWLDALKNALERATNKFNLLNKKHKMLDPAKL